MSKNRREKLKGIIGKNDFEFIKSLLDDIFSKINKRVIYKKIKNQELLSFIDELPKLIKKKLDKRKVLKFGRIIGKVQREKSFMDLLNALVDEWDSEFVQTNSYSKSLLSYLKSIKNPEKVIIEILDYKNRIEVKSKVIMSKCHRFYSYDNAENLEQFFNSFLEVYQVLFETYYKNFLILISRCENIKCGGKFKSYEETNVPQMLKSLGKTLPKKYQKFLCFDSANIRNAESHSSYEIILREKKIKLWNINKGKKMWEKSYSVSQAHKEIEKLAQGSSERYLYCIPIYMHSCLKEAGILELVTSNLSKEELEKEFQNNNFIKRMNNYIEERENYFKRKNGK